ncbi:MAG: lycopene cyclase family protein, partial [Anaerolineae bacterium]
MIRAADFYRFMRAQLTALPNVDVRLARVESIADGEDWAEVLINEVPFRAKWVFDSRYRPSEYRPLTQRYRYLTQHFLGWEIETVKPIFTPAVPRLFDFRAPQRNVMACFYVLPLTERRGLVEYTLFSDHLLPLETYQEALRGYIETVLKAHSYRILEEEKDLIPMTDHPFPRRAGQRILNIGTRGGRVKPSSGYAFHRIQQDAKAIVRPLEARGHPFDLPEPPRRYRMFDAMLLQILHRQGHLGKAIFLRLFQRNPIQRIFRFLDKEDNLWENLKVMASVPPLPFARAWLHIVLLGRA